MPELPEAERAAKLLRDTVVDGTIESIDTSEDTIVFEGVTHTDFAKELTGQKINGVHRHGKVFWLELDGEGRHPVLHFGMTGMIQIQGQEPTWYRRRPKETGAWPPRFMKFIMNVKMPSSDDLISVAFLDPRRLARIRLRQDPRNEAPVSELGFDPILSMPSVEDFSVRVLKRTPPIKALLLDQAFSAGVGNWVADEILYHSRIHPEQRANTLTEEQVQQLHHFTQWVCQTAVDVNADSQQFPENWLFKHRWGKGKKEKHSLVLPSGEPATIKWITVGGRTSAYVEELQPMPDGGRGKAKAKRKAKDAMEDDDEVVGEEVAEVVTGEDDEVAKPKRKKAKTEATHSLPSKPKKGKKAAAATNGAAEAKSETVENMTSGRRRSTRLSSKGAGA